MKKVLLGFTLLFMSFPVFADSFGGGGPPRPPGPQPDPLCRFKQVQASCDVIDFDSGGIGDLSVSLNSSCSLVVTLDGQVIKRTTFRPNQVRKTLLSSSRGGEVLEIGNDINFAPTARVSRRHLLSARVGGLNLLGDCNLRVL